MALTYDEYRVRGPDGVVHWTRRDDVSISTRTQCGRTLANLYEIDSASPYKDQFALCPYESVTCVGCLVEGPYVIESDEEDHMLMPWDIEDDDGGD